MYTEFIYRNTIRLLKSNLKTKELRSIKFSQGLFYCSNRSVKYKIFLNPVFFPLFLKLEEKIYSLNEKFQKIFPFENYKIPTLNSKILSFASDKYFESKAPDKPNINRIFQKKTDIRRQDVLILKKNKTLEKIDRRLYFEKNNFKLKTGKFKLNCLFLK